MNRRRLLIPLLLCPAWIQAGCPENPSEPTLTMDRTNYVVGESPTYILCGAAPHSRVAWSSWKNEVSTGESEAEYVPADERGQWIQTGGAWSSAQTGFWTKEAHLVGTATRLKVFFNVSASLPTHSGDDYKGRLGVAHWAPMPVNSRSRESFLLTGAKWIQNLGGEQIFVSIGPGSINYGFVPDSARSLKEVAETETYKKLFALPFKTFVLVAYGFANEDWLKSKPKPVFDAIRFQKEKEEFRDLARYLTETYRGSGKTFILKNWEGDWGLVDSYGEDPVSVATPYQIANHVAYHQARRQGLVEGRGASRVVLDSLEFWRVGRPQQNRPSFLRDVISQVDSDYISVSAWEITVPPTPELRRRLIDDITFIRNYPGVRQRPLFVAEFGFYAYPDNDARIETAIHAFLDAGATQAYYWQITGSDDGVIRPGGIRNGSWHLFRRYLGARNDAQLVSVRTHAPAVPGQPVTLTIQMKNTGTVPWDAANGYQLEPIDSAAAASWGMRTLPILDSNESIRPGETKTFGIQGTVPTNPSAPLPRWQMAQQNVESFGELSTAGASAGSIPEPRTYPNPWRQGSAPGITFDQLQPGTTIDLYTLSGRWMKSLSESGGGVLWKLDNDSGEGVASGYYFYVIKNADGQTKRGTLAVIR